MSISNQRGNVLLFVIAGIAMIASIAMGMFYMTSTSSLGQAGGSGMNRAYYLALAGKDYALANWSSGLPITGEFILSDTERFELSKTNFKITSTGIVNKDTPFEAKKTIVAQSSSPVRKHFFESFEDLSKWATTTQVGGHATPAVSGDKALSVTSSSSAFGSGLWSFLQLKTGPGVGSAVDFSPAWKDAGYCLSYDLQDKIANSQLSYMAGRNFKVSNSGDEFYGISFLRAKRSGVWSWSCFCFIWSDTDSIPLELKPPPIWDTYTTVGLDRYSQPAIVLWKRQGGAFNWLAYKILSSSDFVVNASNYLVDWSNLQVRLIEAYPLGFTTGGPTPLLHGSVVVGGTSGASARINGTPVMTSETWSSTTAAGTLTLTNISGSFQTGENLLVSGTTRAVVSVTLGAKTNYIRVYYGDVTSHGTTNNIPTDNIRGSNPRIIAGSNNVIHWPVDNVSDWSAYYDYMTLVQWADQTGTGATRLGGSGTKEANAIIQDNSLLTPSTGSINYSGIALHATGNTAIFTYFDDFAIQY